MALSDKKILTSERNAVYVKSNVGRRLTGTVEQNKDAFDKFPQLIMDKYNELIDLLTALGLDSIATDLSSRYTKTETDTAIATETNDLVETITYTASDGKFTVTTKGGTSTTIDTNIEKIPASFELVEEDDKTYLKVTNDDGSTSKTDVSSLVNIYSFSDSDTVDFTENSGQVTAIIKNNSITIDHLSLAAISTIEGYVSSAAESAVAAAGSATAAETSADNANTFMESAEGYSNAANEAKTASQTAAKTAAEQSATATQKAAQAENSRLLAQSYAVGGTGTRQGEDTDNARYYAEQAAAVVGGDFITKVTTPTAGNIPKLTSDGQLEDSGVGLDDVSEHIADTDIHVTAAEKASWGNTDIITATNTSIAISAWAADTTYDDFPFRAAVTITGCTADHKPDVTFSLADAMSGNFAPIAETYTGGVYIYAAETPEAAVTVPTITLLKKKVVS